MIMDKPKNLREFFNKILSRTLRSSGCRPGRPRVFNKYSDIRCSAGNQSLERWKTVFSFPGVVKNIYAANASKNNFDAPLE